MAPVFAPNPEQTSPLSQPVTVLHGVGKERTELLKRLGIVTVEDLLLHRPARYEDRRKLKPIADLELGAPAIVRGTIVAMGVKWFRQHTKSIFELVVDDGSARLYCRWWNLPFMEKNFERGQEVVICGKLKELKPRAMDHPEAEIVEAGEETPIHLNRITPVYPLTEGITQRWLRGLIYRTLINQGFLWVSGEAPESVRCPPFRGQEGASILKHPKGWTPNADASPAIEGLSSRAQAIRDLHFPEDYPATDAARRRLAFDEFLALQEQIRVRRKNFEIKSRALPCRGDNHLIKPFLAKLGFKLTDAQTKVLREIRADMGAEHPMRRLLQGDVGSGKTVVSACSALMALESGYDAALMAPTEILAEQHFTNFSKWFEPLGITVQLLTGASKPSPRSSSRITHHASRIEPATFNLQPATLTVGTHALIHEGFKPENLGLVIIDEQHRFGVAQRERLVRKGVYPHLLIMTATPIPRTLGLTLYGDLDVSVIESAPAGRGRIQTFLRKRDKLPEVWKFIRAQVAAGRQAYVIYPRVDETGGDADLKTVTKEFAVLQDALKPHRVGLMHGRLKSLEKDAVMKAFRANQIEVLLATSLVEVGVDVPNATVMLIENAEQFGLAQLHQLRGRIGRGTHNSYCILIAAKESRESLQRLRILEQTTNGFELAEADLKLRGPGELLGHEQSGVPEFRFADLVNDFDLLVKARDFANSNEPQKHRGTEKIQTPGTKLQRSSKSES
jgi:ATP-dependent DNA helicase RecG